MGKIKISIHNLYKNIINYNIIGGASITASVSNDNSSAILKKILLLLIRKKELNIQITNLINNYQKEIKDINDELKKRDSYKRDLERDLDELPKELSNYIEEYKQTFYELESIKQTNFNIKDITLLEYKNIKVNEEYLNIISLISKYWSKTSFDENDIKEILNIDKDIQKHMKEEILKKAAKLDPKITPNHVSALTNDEVLDILKKTISELTKKSEINYFKKQIIETIDYFISFVQDAKTKDSKNILKYYEDLKGKDLSIIKLPEETSLMFGTIKFELNKNLELVGDFTNVKDPKKLEKYKKKLEAFKGIDESRYFKIPLDKFVKQQMKNREDYAKLNNFWYLIDQKGKNPRILEEKKFKFLGIDQGNINLLNEIVNTYNINFTYKGNGNEFKKEDHLETWEKKLYQLKKAIEEPDKRKPKEAVARAIKEAEAAKKKALEEAAKKKAEEEKAAAEAAATAIAEAEAAEKEKLEEAAKETDEGKKKQMEEKAKEKRKQKEEAAKKEKQKAEEEAAAKEEKAIAEANKKAEEKKKKAEEERLAAEKKAKENRQIAEQKAKAEKKAKAEQKAQAVEKAKEEQKARNKRFILEEKKFELEKEKFEETKKTQKQRLELEKEKFDAENYTLADCRKNIQEYKFYNLRNQIEMSKLMTKYNKNEYIIKNLLKDNNFDFAKVEKKLEGDKFKSYIGKYDEGKIVIKVPKIY